MSKKLIYLVSFVLVLGLVLMSVAKAADPDLAAYWKFDETSGEIAFDSTSLGSLVVHWSSMVMTTLTVGTDRRSRSRMRLR